MMKKTAILAPVVLMAGCAHTSTVQDAGNGMHSITATADLGGYTGSREEAIAQANAYCAKSDRTASIDRFEDHPGVTAKGEQTSTMVFTCVVRPPLQLK
jgi:uncharacterized lipoprotein YajG